MRGTDIWEGKGVYISNGIVSVLQGFFKNGQLHGHGRQIVQNRLREGNFEAGLLVGYGIELLRDGSKFEGTFENNLRHGLGAITN